MCSCLLQPETSDGHRLGAVEELHIKGGKQGILTGSSQFSGNGAESEERLQQVVCYRAGDGTAGLDLEERREAKICS